MNGPDVRAMGPEEGSSLPAYPHLAMLEPQPGAPPTRLGVCMVCGQALPLVRLQVALRVFRQRQQRHPEQLLWRAVPLVCADERACAAAQRGRLRGREWSKEGC